MTEKEINQQIKTIYTHLAILDLLESLNEEETQQYEDLCDQLDQLLEMKGDKKQ